MNHDVKILVDRVKDMSMNDIEIDRNTLLALLELVPGSKECDYLGAAAREVAKKKGKNKGGVSSSVGLDLAPCPVSCKFCSLGAKWGLIDKEYVLPEGRVIKIIRTKFEEGFKQFIIRTTEFYDLNKLGELAKRIRKEVPGEYVLTVNTGELTLDEAKMLKESGFNGAYHALRLREGIDTPITPETRIATIKAIKESGLFLGCGIDPIGIEHTSEEIADLLSFYATLRPMGLCTMKRINVEGTPMGGMEDVSDDRMAQITAVIRLVQGGRNVVIQPPIYKALEYGANSIALETGANPRYNEHDDDVWVTIGHDEAIQMLRSAKYDV